MLYIQKSCKSRHNCNNHQEYRAGQCYPVHNGFNVINRILTRFDTGYKTVVGFHLVCHLSRINRYSRIEIRKQYNQNSKYHIIPKTRRIHKRLNKSRRFIANKTDKSQWNKHNGLSKNDRHDTGSIDFQRQILTCTANLLVSDNTLGILYRHFPHRPNQHYRCGYGSKQDDKFYKEHYQTACLIGHSRHDFLKESLRQTCNDTNHNDQRNAIAYTFIGDSLTNPKYKHTSRSQYD